MKKLLQWLAVAVFACLVFIPGIAQAQTVPVQLTSFQVTNLEKQPVNSVGLHSKFYMNINWDATGQELHNGDSFDIELPTFLRFPDDAVIAVAAGVGTVALTFILTSRFARKRD